MKTYLDSTEVDKPLTKPCEDCPFRRKSLAGWLGAATPADYCHMAHTDVLIECHCHTKDGKPVQCAGAAIYRANVAKRVDPPGLRLPKDAKKVFTSPVEFLEHHSKKKLTTKQVQQMMVDAMHRRMLMIEEEADEFEAMFEDAARREERRRYED